MSRVTRTLGTPALRQCCLYQVSTILGQVNFFLEFEVCFFRARALFDVRPKQAP